MILTLKADEGPRSYQNTFLLLLIQVPGPRLHASEGSFMLWRKDNAAQSRIVLFAELHNSVLERMYSEDIHAESWIWFQHRYSKRVSAFWKLGERKEAEHKEEKKLRR